MGNVGEDVTHSPLPHPRDLAPLDVAGAAGIQRVRRAAEMRLPRPDLVEANLTVRRMAAHARLSSRYTYAR